MTPKEQLEKLLDCGNEFVTIDLSDILRPRNGTHEIRPIPCGPKYEKWLQDVNTYNERYLKTHPAYHTIKTAVFHHRDNAAEQLIGSLESVYNDAVFWENIPKNVINVKETSNKDCHKYDVFISHASKDKAPFVEELNKSLEKLSINIFYDKNELEWGDNWANKILDALKNTEFAIIVISENFFDRDWPEKELKELLMRQNENGQKLILPILHNITFSQLQEKYPAVANIHTFNSSELSCDEIALHFAAQLIKRLKS